MIGLRGTITVGGLAWLASAAGCAVADQMRHVHHATNYFDTPVKIGIAAACLYFASPLLFTVLYMLRSGRLTNAMVHRAYSAPAIVVASLAISNAGLAPYKPTLLKMPTAASIPIGIVAFIVVIAVVGAITGGGTLGETPSLYGVFFKRFRGLSAAGRARAANPNATIVREPRIVSGTYIPAYSGGASTPSRARGTDTQVATGYHDQRDYAAEAHAHRTKLNEDNMARTKQANARQAIQNQFYAEHQAQTKQNLQDSINRQNRQTEINRQHAEAKRAADDRAADERRRRNGY